MGKDQSGRQYVYDPYPKENQPQVVYMDQNLKAYDTYVNGTLGVKNNNQVTVEETTGGITHAS